MSYQAAIIELFLSSPDDVKAEREFVVRTAAEWNRLRGRDTACFISILTWEDVVAPALLDRPQEVVNQQIGNDYDVYLGIMWTRFGTPTGVAESGTEEEFLRALDQAKGGRHIRIATMFKTGDISLSNVDALQLHKVQKFKKMVSEEGGFYREFSDINSLKSALNLLFEQVSKDKDIYSKIENYQIDNCEVTGDYDDTAADDAHEGGLFEVGEEFAKEVERFSKNLTVIMEAENAHTNEISGCSAELSEINSLGAVDKARIKSVFRRVSTSMDELSGRYASVSTDVELGSRKIADLIDEDLRIRFRVEDWKSSGSENLNSAAEFSNILKTSIDQLQVLSQSTSDIPPLSSQVNTAKSRLAKERKKILEIFSSLKESIDNSVKFFRDQKSYSVL